jgi:hypothetical protein
MNILFHAQELLVMRPYTIDAREGAAIFFHPNVVHILHQPKHINTNMLSWHRLDAVCVWQHHYQTFERKTTTAST